MSPNYATTATTIPAADGRNIYPKPSGARRTVNLNNWSVNSYYCPTHALEQLKAIERHIEQHRNDPAIEMELVQQPPPLAYPATDDSDGNNY